MNSIRELFKDEFPKQLLEIPNPPKKLYIEGTLPPEGSVYLAIVGSRKCTTYGKEAVFKLVKGLAGLPVVIVSGLALGIDAWAHEAAMEAGLKTVAVPGSGLDASVLYPSTNRNLAKRIIEKGGCLISEFEPKFKATAWSFPQRNRIMAGLSQAVFVIEAELKSGTLITSKYATDFNRDVFALPGSIFSTLSAGPHMLIRLGATPITSSEDLREALGFERAQENITQNYDDCSPEEIEVIKTLTEPLPREVVLELIGGDASELNAIISMLEIKGKIKESGGKLFLI